MQVPNHTDLNSATRFSKLVHIALPTNAAMEIRSSRNSLERVDPGLGGALCELVKLTDLIPTQHSQ